MKAVEFKLYFPSGKTFMTHNFDDEDFADCFSVFDSEIFFTDDTTISVAKFSSSQRAYEVYDDLINAYHAHKDFTLPKE